MVSPTTTSALPLHPSEGHRGKHPSVPEVRSRVRAITRAAGTTRAGERLGSAPSGADRQHRETNRGIRRADPCQGCCTRPCSRQPSRPGGSVTPPTRALRRTLKLPLCISKHRSFHHTGWGPPRQRLGKPLARSASTRAPTHPERARSSGSAVRELDRSNRRLYPRGVGVGCRGRRWRRRDPSSWLWWWLLGWLLR
jgi:hypothetical protein